MSTDSIQKASFGGLDFVCKQDGELPRGGISHEGTFSRSLNHDSPGGTLCICAGKLIDLEACIAKQQAIKDDVARRLALCEGRTDATARYVVETETPMTLAYAEARQWCANTQKEALSQLEKTA